MRESTPLLPKHVQTNTPTGTKSQDSVNQVLIFSLCIQLIEIFLVVLSWLYEYHFNFIEAFHFQRGRNGTNPLLLDVIMACFVKFAFTILFMICSNRLTYWTSTFACIAFLVFLVKKAIALDEDPVNSSLANIVVTFPVLLTVSNWVLLNYHYDEKQEKKSTSTENDETPSVKQLSWIQLLRILKPYFWPKGMWNRVRAFSTYFMLIFSKVCNLVAPLFMASATNSLNHGNAPVAIRSVFIFCLLTFLSKVLKELQSFVYLKVNQTAYIELAEMTYRHLHSLSLDWHLKKKLGDTLRSMDRGVESANMVVSYLFLYLVPAIVESIVVIVIFAIHFQLATLSLLSFGSLVLYAVITIKITLWRKKFREATTKHDNEYHNKATDTLVNFETVKYFTNEEYEVDRFSSAITKYQKFTMDTKASLSLLNSSQALIIQAAIAGVLIISVPHVINADHAMDVGGFIAVSVYLANLFAPLSFLGSIYNMVINAFVDMRKLSELLSLEPDVLDIPNAPPLQLNANQSGVTVELRDVHFYYPDQDPGNGLQGVSFTIPPGTTTAIVGHTGAGKTTISRLLFRFYDIQRGQIFINYQDISKVRQKSLRKHIGIVPQDTVLFNDTILYNVKYGNMDAPMSVVEQAARDAQIYDFIQSLPDKWESKVGERGLKLSGGEKQRIAIARTLLKDPPFVILDEATSALDTETEQLIQKALHNLRKGRTMLVIAHRLSTVRNADQIIVLEAGKVLERGSHDSLIEMEGKYQNLWKIQLEPDTRQGHED